MAYWTSITALDGLPLEICTPGPALPSNLDRISYVNPRTSQRETVQCETAMAWAGTPGPPTKDNAVVIEWSNRRGTLVR